MKELKIDDNTLLVFASDNGPQGETAREMGNQGTPDIGNPVPSAASWASDRGMVRTSALVRSPGKIKPGTSSSAMFSIMDFLPTFATLIGSKIPSDRPIDGVDQTDVLFGKAKIGNRDSLLSFVGADLVAARWKQCAVYFTDVHPTGIGPQRQPGMFSPPARRWPGIRRLNIQMDPHEDLRSAALFGWTVGRLRSKRSRDTRKRSRGIPNPPAPNITQFWGSWRLTRRTQRA